MTAYEEFLVNQTIKQETKKVQREIETYKKALELLAEDSVTRLYATKNEIIEHYLEKAQEV